MDKLQSEYEALQQKLALLKRGPIAAAAAPASAAPGSNGSGGAERAALQPAQLPSVASMTPLAAGKPAPAATPLAQPQRAGGENRAPAAAAAGASAPAAGATAPRDRTREQTPSESNLQLTCSLPEGAAALAAIRFSERHQGSALCAAAAAAFEEAEFVRLCEQAMCAQLQRTKEGATAQSRILELAGMVKLLRRCLREALSRTASLVDQGVRLEKDAITNAESVHLDAGSVQRRLEADAALARKEAAQVSAAYKAEKAVWVAEIDMQKIEVARLSRELEALEEARARAREEAQRVEKARIQLEAEMKELRKAAEQRAREAVMTQGEADKALRDGRAAFERREATLLSELQAAREAGDGAARRAESLASQLSTVAASAASLQASLESKTAAEAALQAQLDQAQAQLSELRGQLGAEQAARTAMANDLRAAQNQVTLLETDTRIKGTRLEAAERALAAEEQRHQQESAALEEQLASANAARSAAAAEALAAGGDADEARRAASEAGAARARTEAALQQLQAQHEALVVEHATLKQAARSLEDAAAAAREDASAAATQASEAEAALAAAKEEASAQASRLAHLEGEFTALQELMGEGEQRDMVGRLLSRIGSLQCAAAAAEATRRQLHNQMVELRGNIRVFCRVRPHPHSAVRCLPGGAALALAVDGREHAFTFDKVFGPSTAQAAIFGEVSELVQSALDGYHVCLFSYGQTGAGKTYTMQGTPDPAGAGIIPRAVELILARVQALEAQEWAYSLEASFIEVYNNTLRDLLADGAARSADAGRITDANAIKHDASGGHTVVAGASRVAVAGAGHAAELIRRASEARACAETAMNSTSSRSHCVFMLYIAGAHPASGTRLTGCLCLVDLAGSERLDRSLAEAERKKEACSINQSLSALGDVFASLSSKSAHVPYRNSKLTYLLQPCLGGDGKTLMFVNINPEPASANESLCSLKFAAKVNGCETAAKGGARRNVSVAASGGGGGGGSGAGGSGWGSTFAPMDSSFDSGRPSLAGGKRVPGGAADKGPKRSRLG
ncbi:kinesin [Raphidocelis subcapitata]|uniref:Kinesin n=1 Tax=Raphidocelis subcapitata TaxID=307507 RepID=A0A2V0PP27_9CHLO|nr:kinesin [Raphidocelis subcapitata]|eukprot:GBF99197.1 kinesin [Raphidocelis subcapitata]